MQSEILKHDIVSILAEFDSFLENVFDSPLSSPATSECGAFTCSNLTKSSPNETKLEEVKNFKNAKNFFKKQCKTTNDNSRPPFSTFLSSKPNFRSNLVKASLSNHCPDLYNEPLPIAHISIPSTPLESSYDYLKSTGTFVKAKTRRENHNILEDPRLLSYDKVVQELQNSSNAVNTNKTAVSPFSAELDRPNALMDADKIVNKKDIYSKSSENVIDVSKSSKPVLMTSIASKLNSNIQNVYKENELKIQELQEEDLMSHLHQLLSTRSAKIAAGIMSVEFRGTKALELWTRRATQGYEGVSITNMTTSWRDGLAFCALIHHFRPDLIEFKSLKSENILENNALAFRVAEQQLGIPALLDAEDMVETAVPDRLSILTYVSQFYQAFSAQGLIGPGGRRSPTAPNAKPTIAPTASPTITPTKPSPIVPLVRAKPTNQLLTTIQTKTDRTEFKTDKETVGVPRAKREECYVCSKPVFLAERLLIGFPGQLRHRTCFKCDRCATQLTLASFYETEKGQFCCETCPDEERAVSSEDDKDSSLISEAKKTSDRESSSEADTEDSSASSEDENEQQETSMNDKPRSIFLRQTLEESDDSTLKLSTSSRLEQVSDQARCDPPAKSAPTFPPDKVLDNRQIDIKEDSNRFSLVRDRLKIFDNNSSKEPTNQPIPVNKQCESTVSNNFKSTHIEDIETTLTTDKKSDPSVSMEEPVSQPSFTDGEDSKNGTDDSNTSPPPKPKRLFLDMKEEFEIHKNKTETLTKQELTEQITIEDKLNNKEITDHEVVNQCEKQEISPETNEEKPENSLKTVASETENENYDSTEHISKPVDSDNKIPKSATHEEEETVAVDSNNYPDQLNPFEFDEESSTEQLPIPETTVVVTSLNPFGDSDEEESKETKNNLNPFLSDDEDSDFSVPVKSKIPPPRPPPPTLRRDAALSPRRLIMPSSECSTPPSPSLSLRSSSSEQNALRIKKKLRVAPTPPGFKKATTEGLAMDEGLTAKMQKDLQNQNSKMMGGVGRQDCQNQSSAISNSLSTPKSERGEWRRKKGPAPLLPVPQKRSIRKLPMRQVQQELNDIEIKQTELERQGVLLETTIRGRTEVSSADAVSLQSTTDAEKSYTSISSNGSQNSVEVEDMILQLFELVNEKNELFRRQTELMYLKREKRLEEEYAELEYQIRCLMLKPSSERSQEDISQEEELIARLVKLVEQRDEIVNCLEMERQREVVEDESIASHLIKYQEKHIEGIDSDEGEKVLTKKKKKKIRLLKKKKKKKDKEKHSEIDADKDVDETELKKKKKKIWFKKPHLPL